MSQKRMAELFGVEVPTINYHLKEIYKSDELTEEATIRKIRIVQIPSDKWDEQRVLMYNLDLISTSFSIQLNSFHYGQTHSTAAA